MRAPWSIFAICATLSVSSAGAQEFSGWETLRVIRQEGRPRILRAADLDGDGRQELIVVNNRSSRLDVYSWLDRASRKDPEAPEKEHPNELPMAPELKHTEVQLEHLPNDVVVEDLDADGNPELIVLVSPPSQVLVYRCDEEGDWGEQIEYDLLEGETSSKRRSLLLRRRNDGKFQLLVSLKSGIQQLLLEPGGRAQWLTPREKRDRVNWWLADLDGDGHEDLVEQTRESTDSIRWYRGSENGSLAPAAVLFDRAVNDAELIRYNQFAELALLDGSVRQLLRRYRLNVGQPNAFGQRRPLALEDSSKTAWCGMWQGEKRALVAADRSRPRLLSYVLSDTVWDK